MKIEIQENEITIVKLGPSHEDNGVMMREVTFEIQGKEFQRDIILGPNGTGADYTDPEKFYMMNKEQVDASLIVFLSENHLYDNLG
ncbi:MAG: hypothetical protein ACXWB4_07300 [Kaistella sp.]